MTDRYKPAPTDDCGCDPRPDPRCPPCDPPPACELECLVRPEFHCGQELTEEDLNALVRWTDRRLARTRYRDGWGVACGLDLCIDPRCPTRVKITPGYAVSCCGDDLVLCEPACIDLRDCCPDPCWPEGYDADEQAKKEQEFTDLMARRLGVGHLPFRLRSCTPVDICLEADDCAVQSVPHPGADCGCGCGGSGGGCGCGGGSKGSDRGDGDCVTIRRKEATKIVLCKPQKRPDPVRTFREEWDRTARIEEDILEELKGREKDPKAVIEVLGRLKLCAIGVADRILEALTPEDLVPDLTHAGEQINLGILLFWYLIDRRLQLRARPCHDCDEDKVCLGRAWLFGGTDRAGRPICFIGWLDTADPVRRRLGPVRLPAPEGGVNLVELALGRSPEAAALALSAAGIAVREIEEPSLPMDGALLKRMIGASPFASWSDQVTLIGAVTCHGPRVIGWYQTLRPVVGTPVTDAPAQPAPAPAPATPDRSDDVIELDRIGPARAKLLHDQGIVTVGDLVDSSRRKLVAVVSTWSSLGRDETPESFTDWLLEHAKAYLEGRG